MKKAGIVAGIAAAVIGAVLIVLLTYGQRWVQQEIREHLRRALPAHITEVGELRLDLWRATIRIKGVAIHPADSTSAAQPILRVEEATLEGVRWWRSWRTGVLTAQRLVLKRCIMKTDTSLLNLEYRWYDQRWRDSARQAPRVSISSVSGDFTIHLLHANTIFFMANGRFGLTPPRLAEDRRDSTLRPSFTIHVNDVVYQRQLYTYALKGAMISGNRQSWQLLADTFRCTPRYQQMAFARVLGHQTDRIDARLTDLRLEDLDPRGLANHQVYASKLTVKSMRIKIFRDRRLPLLPDRQPLPMDMLRRLPVKLRIGMCRLSGASVVYEEQPRDGGTSGLIRVERGALTLSPLISHPQTTDPATSLLQLSASLMGSGSVNASIVLPLRANRYQVTGAIQHLDLTTLNEASIPLGKIQVRSGQLDSLGFRFSFDSKRSEGKVVGIYHQLIVAPLIGRRNHLRVAGFRAFLLRRVIIPLNKGRDLPERKRTGRINCIRNPDRKLSFYLLQSLLSGIRSSFSLGFLLPG